MDIEINEKEIYKIKVKYNKECEYRGATPKGNLLYLTYYEKEENFLKCQAYNNNSFKYQIDNNMRYSAKLEQKYNSILENNKDLIKKHILNKEYQQIINLINEVV